MAHIYRTGAGRPRRGDRVDRARLDAETAHRADGFVEIDEAQANAILEMRRAGWPLLERQKIIDRLAELERLIADLQDILDLPERRRIIGEYWRSSRSTAPTDATGSPRWPTATCRTKT